MHFKIQIKISVLFWRKQFDGKKEMWSQWLPFWCYSYNNTVHTETKNTPFELVFGRASVIPCRVSEYIEPLYNPESYPLDLKHKLQVAQKMLAIIYSKVNKTVNYLTIKRWIMLRIIMVN